MHAEVARLHRAPFPAATQGLGFSTASCTNARAWNGHAITQVAAADAGVLVHEHDAVGTPERRAGGADVDARRVRAVLAHERQGGDSAGRPVAERHLVDPPGVGGGTVDGLQPVLVVAGPHAGVAVSGALGGIDEHPVAYLAADRFVGFAGPAGADERHEGESGRQGRTGHDPRPRKKPAPRHAAQCYGLVGHSKSLRHRSICACTPTGAA